MFQLSMYVWHCPFRGLPFFWLSLMKPRRLRWHRIPVWVGQRRSHTWFRMFTWFFVVCCRTSLHFGTFVASKYCVQFWSQYITLNCVMWLVVPAAMGDQESKKLLKTRVGQRESLWHCAGSSIQPQHAQEETIWGWASEFLAPRIISVRLVDTVYVYR